MYNYKYLLTQPWLSCQMLVPDAASSKWLVMNFKYVQDLLEASESQLQHENWSRSRPLATWKLRIPIIFASKCLLLPDPSLADSCLHNCQNQFCDAGESRSNFEVPGNIGSSRTWGTAESSSHNISLNGTNVVFTVERFYCSSLTSQYKLQCFSTFGYL